MVTPTEDIRLLLLYLSGITLFRDLRSFHKLNSKLLLLGSGFFDRNQNAKIFLSVKSYSGLISWVEWVNDLFISAILCRTDKFHSSLINRH